MTFTLASARYTTTVENPYTNSGLEESSALFGNPLAPRFELSGGSLLRTTDPAERSGDLSIGRTLDGPDARARAGEHELL